MSHRWFRVLAREVAWTVGPPLLVAVLLAVMMWAMAITSGQAPSAREWREAWTAGPGATDLWLYVGLAAYLSVGSAIVRMLVALLEVVRSRLREPEAR